MKTTLFSSVIGDVPVDMAFINKFDATIPPGATNDSTEGYSVGSSWIDVSGGNAYTCIDATEGAAVWNLTGDSGIDPAELALLNGALPATVVASKAAIYGADSMLAILAGAIAALGTNQATAAPLTKQLNAITGADGTVGIALPAAAVNKPVFVLNTSASAILPVYPVAAGNDQINAEAANAAVNLGPGRGAWFTPTSATQWYVEAAALNPVTPAAAALVAQGVAAGYKVARGTHVQIAASDTIVTGLATVVAVVAVWKSAPTVKQLFLSADVGNQSGAPAAGSILINTYKPTAVNDVTPTPATDFTDNLNIDWIAIGI